MQIRSFLTPEQFLATCGPVWERDEALYSLMLGLLAELVRRPAARLDEVRMYAFAHEVIHGDAHSGHVHAHAGEPYFFVLQTAAQRGIIVAATDQLPPEKVAVIAACLRGMHPETPAIVGPRALVQEMATLWSSKAAPHFLQLAHKTSLVVPPARPAAGRMRTGDAADSAVIAEWLMAFSLESLTVEMTREDAERLANVRLAEGAVQVWEDAGLVSMLILLRPTRSGCSIGYVYTPPAQRGRGYASALVAAATQAQLDQGRTFVTLFTNEANPTSNKIYGAVGYTPFAEFAHYWLHPE
jgi:uncharacterized protein